jgi:uncharacterized protein (DUF1800 family)
MASLNPLQGNLGHRKAAHLLRRLSFRYTKPKVDEMANQTAPQALATLLQLYPLNLEQPIYKDLTVTDAPIITWCLPIGSPSLDAENFKTRPWLPAWWLREALLDPGAGHKMTLFFHQFMQSTIVNTGRTEHFFDYLSLMRWSCLGNFKKLAQKVISDNTMLRYLNNNENTKANPNENFAREFFELFTIGKGPQIATGDYTTYTEDDIVVAAKVLTGIRYINTRATVDPETGISKGAVPTNQTQFNNLHDTSNKQFSDKFQNTIITGATTPATMENELKAFVDMIFAQKATARTLVQRLYTTFVGPHLTAEVQEDIIEPLADLLIASDFEVKPVLEKLFASQHFFDADDSDNKDEIIGSIIRSPMDIALHTISFFGLPIPDPTTQTAQYFALFSRGIAARMLTQAGFSLFYASDVAGYPAYYQNPDFSRAWFSSSSIIARYKVSANLLTGKINDTGGNGANNQLGVKLDIVDWTRNSGFFSDAEESEVLVEEILRFMLPEKVDAQRFDYFLNQVFLNGLPADDWTYEWQNYLITNDATEVRLPLERLLKAIMYSPEFQTL